MDQMKFATLSPENLVAGISQAAAGRISVFIGVSADRLKTVFADVELAEDERLPLMIRPRLEKIAGLSEAVLNKLASTALSLWPFWYAGEDFSSCENTAAGRAAATIKLAALKKQASYNKLSLPWAERAVAFVLDDRVPRFPDMPRQVELQQLCLALHAGGLTLLVELTELPDENQAAGLVRSLEWLAENGPLAVVLLLPEGAEACVGLRRILYGASIYVEPSRNTVTRSGAEVLHSTLPKASDSNGQTALEAAFLGTVRGRPHHNSPAEQKLARTLIKDPDLAQLFAFNKSIKTIRGSCFNVDLVWQEGRVLVEVDGAHHHRDVDVYEADCQRDYELQLSGYSVLRLTSREVLNDTERSVDKIRDFVRMRRANW